MATTKIDLKKVERHYFTAPRNDFTEAVFAEHAYLMIDGQGSPVESAEYTAALAALYPLAYRVKFLSKQELGRDYVIPPLEGLWRADDMDAYIKPGRRDEWRWTLMIMLPRWIEPAHVDEANARVPRDELLEVRMEMLEEGLCFSKLHVGPFADEAPVLARLHHEILPAKGYTFNGDHHEIYLSDPRRVDPARLRTILRQPVRPV